MSSSKAPSQRQLRVGEQIRHALAAVLQRGDINDPYIASHPVTVTEVRCSPDLRRATAFVVPLGGGDPKPMLAALKRVSPYLRRCVNDQVVLKYSPQLDFKMDHSFEEAQHINSLLNHPRVRQDIEDNSGLD